MPARLTDFLNLDEGEQASELSNEMTLGEMLEEHRTQTCRNEVSRESCCQPVSAHQLIVTIDGVAAGYASEGQATSSHVKSTDLPSLRVIFIMYGF